MVYCAYIVCCKWFTPNAGLSFLGLKFWYMLGRECLYDQVTSPWPWVLNLSDTLLHFCFWEWGILCVTPSPTWEGESIRKLHEFLQTSPGLFFPSLISQKCIFSYYITVINLSHGYNYMLSPFSKSPNTGVTLGTSSETMKWLPSLGLSNWDLRITWFLPSQGRIHWQVHIPSLEACPSIHLKRINWRRVTVDLWV